MGVERQIHKFVGFENSIKLLTIIIMQRNIEMFKRLQERITALEMRVEAIEGEKLRRIDTDGGTQSYISGR